MKVFIPFFLLMFVSSLFSQSEEEMIQDIREKYKETRAQYKSYEKVSKELLDESTEGGEIIAYKNSKEIRLIEVEWAGEMGKRTIEYYFYDGQLYFAFEQIHNYNAPVYYDEEIAKESGGEHFDPKKTIKKANRYYFYNKKLIRWLDPEKKKVDVNDEQSQEKAKDLLQDANQKLMKLK